AYRGCERRIVDPAGKQPEAGVQKHGVDAIGIHIGDAGMRVEPARLAVLVFQRVGSNDALACADAPIRPMLIRLSPTMCSSMTSRSLPFSPLTMHGARSRNFGSMYRSQRSSGSRI